MTRNGSQVVTLVYARCNAAPQKYRQVFLPVWDAVGIAVIVQVDLLIVFGSCVESLTLPPLLCYNCEERKTNILHA